MLIYYILLSWPTVILEGHTGSITLLLLKRAANLWAHGARLNWSVVDPIPLHQGIASERAHFCDHCQEAMHRTTACPFYPHDHHGKRENWPADLLETPVKVQGILPGIRPILKGKRYVKTLSIGNVSLRLVNINICANFFSQQSTQ